MCNNLYQFCITETQNWTQFPLALAPLSSADAKSPQGSSAFAAAGAGAAGVLRSRSPRQRRSTLEADPITGWAVGDTGDVRGVRLAAPGI